MKKILSRLMLVMVITMMLIGMTPVLASAKTVTLKPQGFTTSKSVAKKMGQVVKKGTTTVVFSPSLGSGYLKFKAPKKKKYTFTLSGLSTTRSYSNGYFYVMRTYGRGKYITMSKMTTQGGKTSSLYVSSKDHPYSDLRTAFITSRFGRLTLKKGEMVYLYFSFSPGDVLTLNIK